MTPAARPHPRVPATCPVCGHHAQGLSSTLRLVAHNKKGPVPEHLERPDMRICPAVGKTLAEARRMRTV